MPISVEDQFLEHQTDASPMYQQPSVDKAAEYLDQSKRVPTPAEIDQFCRVLHFPAQIQPHGVFMLLDHPKQRKIVACSKNASMIFGSEYSDLLGKDFVELFEESQKVKEALEFEDVKGASPVVATVKSLNIIVNLILAAGPNGLMVDIVELDPTENFLSTTQLITSGIQDFELWSSTKDLCQQVVNTMFAALGYDKVTCMQFADDGEGVVVAERRSPRPSPIWNGVTFLASDIPASSKIHLLKVRSGLIVDTAAGRVDVVGHGSLQGQDVNFQLSQLRRRHKCLEEQMGLWGVRSLATFSVIVDGKLWGLVCGFHNTAKGFCYQTQLALETLVQAFAVRLSQAADQAQVKEGVEALEVSTKIYQGLKAVKNVQQKFENLMGGFPNPCHVVSGCKGAAVWHNGKMYSVGIVPAEGVVSKVVDLIEQRWQKEGSKQTQALRSLKDLDSSFSGLAKIASGALCLPFLDNSMLLFFRGESGDMVTYAGNPQHTAIYDPKSGQMYPRTKYDHFEVTEAGICAKWAPETVKGAEDFAAVVSHLHASSDLAMWQELDLVSQPIFCMNSEGKVSFWSSKMTDMTGICSSAALGKPAADLVALESQQGLQDLTRAGCGPSRKEAARRLRFQNTVEKTQCEVLVHAFGGENGDVCCGVKSTHLTDEALARQQMLENRVERIAEECKILRPNNIVVRDRLLEGPGGGFMETEMSFKYYPDIEDSHESIICDDEFGKTYRMVNTADSVRYAVKKVKMIKAQKLGISPQDLKRDFNKLMQLNIPQVAVMRDCFFAGQGKNFCVVMDDNEEDQTLSQVLGEEKAGLSSARCRVLVQNVAVALDALHSKGYAHLCLTTDNLTINGETNSVRLFNLQLPTLASKATPGDFSSPEKLQNQPLTAAEDMWAAGCIFASMVLGSEKVTTIAPNGIAKQLNSVSEVVSAVKDKNQALAPIVEGLLKESPADRLTARQLLFKMDSIPREVSQAF